MPDTVPRTKPARVSYGFDAPRVMLTLLAAGAAGMAAGVALSLLSHGWTGIAGLVFAALAIVPLALGVSMGLYGLIGKHRMRDRMVGLIDWRGDEQVLDVGTGRGLLLIGAAKRLTWRGRATGIDIWRTEDLSGNSLDQLAENVFLEGLDDKIALYTRDARSLSFADASFDVVLSLFCIHNIEDRQEQRIACREIARVLKPGGRVLVGEWLPTHRYAKTFREAGLKVNSSRTYFSTALALMWMVDAEKPSSSAAVFHTECEKMSSPSQPSRSSLARVGR